MSSSLINYVVAIYCCCILEFFKSTDPCPKGYLSHKKSNNSNAGTYCYPKIFLPSSEYQVVYDEQMLPKGLDVKIDLQTGLKYAKLVDKKIKLDSTKPKNKQIINFDDSSLIKQTKHFQPITNEITQQTSIKKKELNNKLDKFIRIKQTSTEYNKIIELLLQIEDMVYDTEYGILFCQRAIKDRFIDEIITNNSFESESEFKQKLLLCKIFGSSVSLSFVGQNILIQDEVVEKIIRYIDDYFNDNNNINNLAKMNYLQEIFYFLGSLIRNNYKGTEIYHKNKGSTILLKTFERIFDYSRDNTKILIKILNLISDTHDPSMIDTTDFILQTQSQLETNEIFKWCNKLTVLLPKFEAKYQYVKLDNQITELKNLLKISMVDCLKTLYTKFDHYCSLDKDFLIWASGEKVRYKPKLEDSNLKEYLEILEELTKK